jgi:hypothetical protein
MNKEINELITLAEIIYKDICSYKEFSINKIELYLLSTFIIFSIIWISSFIPIEDNGNFEKIFLFPVLLLLSFAMNKIFQTSAKSTYLKHKLKSDSIHFRDIVEIIKKEMESNEMSHTKKAIIEIRLKRIGAID